MSASDITGFAELALEAADRRSMESFYIDVVGLPLLSRDEDRTWLAVGDGARLGLWLPGTKEFGDQGGRRVHFAMSVGHGTLEPLRQRLLERQAAVEGIVEHAGGDCSLYFEDPAGNVVEAWDFFVDGAGADQGAQALAP
jgi:catechol-2,3-dioxygenase